MQDLLNLIRNFFLIGLISLGAPIAACTVVEEDDPDAQIHADVDDDDDEVEVDVDD